MCFDKGVKRDGGWIEQRGLVRGRWRVRWVGGDAR